MADGLAALVIPELDDDADLKKSARLQRAKRFRQALAGKDDEALADLLDELTGAGSEEDDDGLEEL